MRIWTLDDIPWTAFDPGRIDPEVVPVIKAASLVERNAADYVAYLRNVFADDDAFRASADQWGREEEQHGDALGQWAERADPGFDYAAS
ncbi:MAG: ferritin-like domain-containing protein, partial [Rhodospirillales bacterium]